MTMDDKAHSELHVAVNDEYYPSGTPCVYLDEDIRAPYPGTQSFSVRISVTPAGMRWAQRILSAETYSLVRKAAEGIFEARIRKIRDDIASKHRDAVKAAEDMETAMKEWP